MEYFACALTTLHALQTDCNLQRTTETMTVIIFQKNGFANVNSRWLQIYRRFFRLLEFYAL